VCGDVVLLCLLVMRHLWRTKLGVRLSRETSKRVGVCLGKWCDLRAIYLTTSELSVSPSLTHTHGVGGTMTIALDGLREEK